MSTILRHASLSTRILFPVLALLIVSIWAFALRATTVLQAQIETQLSAQMTATVGYVAADIDDKLRLRIDVLEEIAASIRPDMLADPSRLQRLLEQHKPSTRLFPTGIFAADRSGTMIADQPPLARRVGNSIAQFGYFHAVLSGGKPVVGSPLMGRFSMRATVPLAVPLRDASGAPAGALVGPVYPSDESLFGLLDETRLSESSYFLVASPRDGLVVAATDKSRILQPLSPPGANPLFDRRRQGFEGFGRTVNAKGVDVLTASKNMQSTGWIVVAAMPAEEAFAQIAPIKRRIYLGTLAVMLLMMAVLYLTLRRQLAPLAQATAAMRAMTRGSAALAPLPGGGEGEIGELVQSFNQLVAERNRLEDRLRHEERHLRELFDAMPIAVGHADRSERITFANEVYRNIYTGGADAVGRTVREVVGEEIYAVVGPLIARSLAGEEVQFDRSFSDDKGLQSARWVRYLPDRDAQGEIIGFFALIEDISERKRTETALAAKSELLRDTFDNMVEGISVFDRNLRLAGWNRRFGELLDFPESLLREDTTFADVMRFNALRGEYGPGDPEEQVRHRVELAAHFEAHHIERTRPNGTVLDIRGSPLPGGGFVTTYTDITERKRAEIALRESRERMNLVVESLAEGVVVQDAQGRIISANRAAQQILGLSEDQLFGRTSIDPGWRTVHEDGSDFPGEQHPAMYTLRTGEPQSGVIMGVHKPEGTLAWLSINSRLLPGVDAPEARCVVTSFADVTGDKHAAARQRLAASVFDHAAEAIMITDRNNDIISVNRAFSEITGYAEAEVIGKNPRLLRSGLQQPEYYQAMWDAIAEKGRWSGEIWDRRRNGEAYCEHLSISAVRDEKGEVTNYCAMFTDITARRNIEAALVSLNAELEQRVAQRTQALEQANREMQSFSYSISHDLRAPLRAINGFSKIVLAANAGKFDAETVDNLGRIAAGAERMGRLIDDLLSLSQISRKELHRQAVDLSQLAGEVAQALMQTQPERRVEILIAPDMRLDGDPGLIQIVLENLVGNAWKFTARTPGAKIEIGQIARDGESICFVRDNGAGFDMRYVDKLFGAFQRLHSEREFEGSGIGLSIVQRIVIKHGGRIWAEGKPDAGASFYFTLSPASTPQAPR